MLTPLAARKTLMIWVCKGLKRLNANFFVKDLFSNGIFLSNKEDSIVWSWNTYTRQVSARLVYEFISFTSLEHKDKWWHQKIWKWPLPQKLRFFFLDFSGKLYPYMGKSFVQGFLQLEYLMPMFEWGRICGSSLL